MTKPRAVACPRCGNAVPWTPESRWRPFCSERCKMIDFGAWATEAYRVTGPAATEDESLAPPSEERSGSS